MADGEASNILIHPEEVGFTTEEQEKRVTGARKIQGAARSRTARQEVSKKRELHKQRSTMPVIDSHGHTNAASIRWFQRRPMVHVHHHEETFFELFYDLIIVVVLMKLSYLKYDFTMHGFFTVCAIFANFWSCWSFLNVYVTMVHQEDGVHRIYYALHVCMSFVMCIATEHPNYDFFDFKYQAFFLIISSIITRMLTVIMWVLYGYNDQVMRKQKEMQDHLPKYTEEQVRNHVKLHGGSIFLACVIFAVTAVVEYDGDPEDEVKEGSHRALAESSYSGSSYASSYGCRRRLGGGSDDYSGCTDEGDGSDHGLTIFLWLLAVAVETLGSVYGSIFDRLPFSGEYAGERMQAWLMLCFGESVIGLLINPMYYDSLSFKAILASFIMVFCLVTVYFDVTDADKFLHLFILRKEKRKAFAYCVAQCPFSLFVFFIGVALKSINYIELGMHDLEVSSGCGHQQDEHIRRLAQQEWGAGGALDQLASKLGAEGFSAWHAGSEHGMRRRLASWTVDDLDELNRSCFQLLCWGSVAVQVCSVLVAYAMPTDQDMKVVNMSRLGSVAIVLFCVIVPFSLNDLATPCLHDYEDSHRRRLASDYASSYGTDSSSSSSSSYGDDGGGAGGGGLTIVEALITTAALVFASFVTSLFSIDVDREHTYKELEDAAHHDRPPELKKSIKSLAARGGVAFVAGAFGSPKMAVAPDPAGMPATIEEA